MPRIYIISRPDETANLSDYLAELLRARYGAPNVVRATPARNVAEYTAAIERDLRTCDVALIVMGRGWLTAPDPTGRPWLQRPDDAVRIALSIALRLGMLIAPVLSDGAQMPAEAELPSDIAGLTRSQAFPVRPAPDFTTDVTRLYQQINTKLTWRPASIALAALTGVNMLNWLALVVLFNVANALHRGRTVGAKAAAVVLVALAFVLLLAATITALTLAARRHSKRWLWVIISAIVLLGATFALPRSTSWLTLFAMPLLLSVLLLFALIGPRRETAYR